MISKTVPNTLDNTLKIKNMVKENILPIMVRLSKVFGKRVNLLISKKNKFFYFNFIKFYELIFSIN